MQALASDLSNWLHLDNMRCDKKGFQLQIVKEHFRKLDQFVIWRSYLIFSSLKRVWFRTPAGKKREKAERFSGFGIKWHHCLCTITRLLNGKRPKRGLTSKPKRIFPRFLVYNNFDDLNGPQFSCKLSFVVRWWFLMGSCGSCSLIKEHF